MGLHSIIYSAILVGSQNTFTMLPIKLCGRRWPRSILFILCPGTATSPNLSLTFLRPRFFFLSSPFKSLPGASDSFLFWPCHNDKFQILGVNLRVGLRLGHGPAQIVPVQISPIPFGWHISNFSKHRFIKS